MPESEATVLAAAQAGNEQAFEQLIAQHRVGLHRHCYRMLGELHDADDALQESLVRAWRGLGRYEPRAPVRSWLYRIATNVCLTALARRTRRGRAVPEEAAVSPYPDRLLAEPAAVQPGPDVLLERGETVELAFVAAVQLLPARQRAVLLLRDVLDFSAGEVAGLLGTSVAAVNSALQRARSTVERERHEARVARPHSPASDQVEQELSRRFADTWRAADIAGLVRLLADDALLTMPPEPRRVVGRDAIRAFLSTVPTRGRFGSFRVVETRANGQPALALYLGETPGGVAHAHALLVLSIQEDTIVSLCRFGDPSLFARFGLPSSLEESP
jgi:RNA polymerase sigma-70 factor (ECF subfamily)